MFRALTLGTDLAFSPQDLAGKHPVSALTELCSKRRCLRHCLPSSIIIFYTRFINFFARVAIPVSKFFCRRWGPPIFTQAFECGPPHKKQYIIKVGILQKLLSYLAPTKVNVNGTEYMGSVAVNDKKKAKANAAMYCLQTMGLVPKDPDNPV